MANHDQLQSILGERDYDLNVKRAIRLADYAHRGQTRKLTGDSFIVHPAGVLKLLYDLGEAIPTQQGGVLHDTIECGKLNWGYLKLECGIAVANMVQDVSKDPTILDRKKCMEAYLAHLRHAADPESVKIADADKVDNITDLVLHLNNRGPDIFKHFSTPPDDQLWWYEEVLKIAEKRLPNYSLNDRLGEQIELFRPQVDEAMGRCAVSTIIM